MSVDPALGANRYQLASARFFLRIGQVGRAAESGRDNYTIPLFPLALILDAEGMLAQDAKHLVRGRVECLPR